MISINLQWWAYISKSTSMGRYHQIYPIESISTNVSVNLHLWLILANLPWQVDIDKSTLLSWYLWIYPIEYISTDLHWRVNIDEFMPSSQYQLIYTDGLISMNLPLIWYLYIYPGWLLLIHLYWWDNIKKYIQGMNINESIPSFWYQQIYIIK